MSYDLNVTASAQLSPRNNSSGLQPGPSIGPFPFNFSYIDVQQPFNTVVPVLPGDTFGLAEKVLDIPAHMRGAAGFGKQVFFLIRTDLPVKVRVRDVAAVPVTMERTLQSGGSWMVGGGDPDVDQIAFEGIANSQPCANVSVWVVARK